MKQYLFYLLKNNLTSLCLNQTKNKETFQVFYIYKLNIFVFEDPLLSGITCKNGGKTKKGGKMVGENLNNVEIIVETQMNNNLNKNNSEKQKLNKSLSFKITF